MKRNTTSTTKFKKLCLALDIPDYIGVGILESLWHLCARETPRGNIGKLSNEDIALSIGYRDDAGVLVASLVSSGWIDVSTEFRLIVHDWHEHADDATKKAIARKGQTFAALVEPCTDNPVQNATVTDLSRNVATSPDISRLPLPLPLPELERDNLAGVGAREPEIPKSPPSSWWEFEDTDPLARQIVEGIRSCPRYDEDEPSEHDVMRVVAVIRTNAPSEQAGLDVLETFFDETTKHSGRKYNRPAVKLREYCDRQVSIWLQTKRQMAIDADRAARQSCGPKSDEIEHRKHPKEGVDFYQAGSETVYVDDRGNPVCGPIYEDKSGRRRHADGRVRIIYHAITSGVKTKEPFNEVEWYRSRGLDLPDRLSDAA